MRQLQDTPVAAVQKDIRNEAPDKELKKSIEALYQKVGVPKEEQGQPQDDKSPFSDYSYYWYK
ncbi:MAG: hypothetical protein LBL26_01285 [Peptococcaceae bacterium]|jgi:hypothetical protein|nr:hypothetical protein [Peptococcaceae bacterium]